MILLISLLLLCAYFVVINIIAYRAFAHDKQYAINKEPRTPEAHLLHLAKIGGWVGAKWAQQKLRHKSYKQPFGSQLNVIGVLHAASGITLLLVFAALSFAPKHSPVKAAITPAVQQVAPPADGLLRISLRPPAQRPAR